VNDTTGAEDGVNSESKDGRNLNEQVREPCGVHRGGMAPWKVELQYIQFYATKGAQHCLKILSEKIIYKYASPDDFTQIESIRFELS
jgi:hypothetical protein